MRRIVLLVCVLAAAGFAPAPLPRPDRNRADPSQADLAAIQGTWRVRLQRDGLNKGGAVGWRLIVSGSRLREVTPDGEVAAEYAVVLNARARPKKMDLLRRDHPRLWKGTYDFRGKELLLSFPLSRDEREGRPTACAPGPKWLFEVCERVSP